MDFLTLGFYAAVCGVLGWAGPLLGKPIVRLGIGAGVGIIAASLLPQIKSLMVY